MKLLFMGTGDIALPAFEAILDSEHEILGLVTQPDKPVGRKQVLTPPRIKELAISKALPVWQPEKARSTKFLNEIEALSPDVIIVMAYGQILTNRLINTPKVAIINLHASLLPLYRGASCIQGPIADGHAQTGVTIMHVVKALDAGDIIIQRKTEITVKDTGRSVHDRLSEMSPAPLLEALDLLKNGNAPRKAQVEEESTYAPKLLRTDGLLNFKKTAPELERLIRAYHPWPGTFFNFSDHKGKQKRMKVFPPTTVISSSALKPGELSAEADSITIGCAEQSALRLDTIQPEGSKKMSVEQFLKGSQLSKINH